MYSSLVGLFDWMKKGPPKAAPPTPTAMLEPHVLAALEATRRPFVRVRFDDELLQLRPVASKVGGIPYLPALTAPPPEPLIFLAQINFAEVPPLESMPLPRMGILQFWITEDDTWGLYGSDGQERLDSHRCIYFPSVDEPQAPTVPTYAGRGPYPVGPHGHRLHFELGREPVAQTDVAWKAFEYRELLNERYDLDYDREISGHKIGGYCDFTQVDPRDPNDPMLSLLQLHEHGMGGWGDAGLAHWFIREADLCAANFANVRYYWDCC